MQYFVEQVRTGDIVEFAVFTYGQPPEQITWPVKSREYAQMQANNLNSGLPIKDNLKYSTITTTLTVE